ncbi:MAG: glycosyltransferase family 2 protein [Lentilactobacillus hilgardii]|jgi:dolichol-phosphate mannosyltransferase|uniref:Glycosyltransferase n=2 Tax=Lentilactobacillus hilgardii TaxID=1588 RepID=A0A6P1EAD3_LENHI|nr:glycosyltransferase family 2 protein [Lentilactobacillus hilgardii]MCI1923450.1 glycosyltransferase family 2 protein [Lentilactobacillus buchneri]RRG07660.1 MAG: glycosyltransferase [Lactobacillus sp.]EEI71136.1 glycosyltransferase, group 2 family protein [Lentilactobacillus hilgardii ATCC 27305]MBZ2202600.1 glycosyltransferase [Lentilactobacillus hilgardii]MBZ2203507.1 glycosyltransferase [Lentilactobacillus hilgardii]
MEKSTDLVSIVLPVFNEEQGIERTIDTLEAFISNQPQEFELIFVDDGSKDKSVALITEAQKLHRNIKIVQFSRNFGHQLAITAGIRYTSGDAVVVMDADLQDPPSVIVEMIKKWKEGAEVVYGKRVSRDGETFFKKITAAIFYRTLRKITSINIPLDTGDFRLMDRKVVHELSKMNETDPYVRGMVSWVGFNQASVEYERQERIAGESKYPLSKMIRLAMDGVTSFSAFPLQLANWLGTLSIIFSIGYLIITLFTGFKTLQFAVFSLFLLVGLVFLSLGLVGSYLYRVFEASRKRPLYIVAKTSGFQSATQEVHDASKHGHKTTMYYARPSKNQVFE